MARAFIGVGANLQPEVHIRAALNRLRKQVVVVNVSTFYLTMPIERPEQPPFVNEVVEITTDLPPLQLKYALLLQIETSLGRIRSDDKDAARPIDLDLLLYDDLVVSSAELTLPDPDITQRAFLAIPLCELAAYIVISGINQHISVVVRYCPAVLMEALPKLTAQLRLSIALHMGK